MTRLATGFFARARGLMGRRLEEGTQALLLRPCSSVHTAFMRYTLDVVYLDRDGSIVKVAHGLRPWRVSWGGRRARQALELPSPLATELELRPGQRLLFG